jgi:serine/threonine-protein kinase HipA
LTFAAGPGNEHSLAVNGRGRDITRADLLAVAREQTIQAKRANEVIDEVATAVTLLPAIAKDFGVTRSTLQSITTAIAEQSRL